jgi:hypothetical protein
MIVVYVCAVVAAIRRLRSRRQDCFNCTFKQAWLRSGLLAFLVTPSVVGDLWLVVLPGPAALGFALLFPGLFFASGSRLQVLLLILGLYVLPWLACTAIIFYLWRLIRWRRLSRSRT